MAHGYLSKFLPDYQIYSAGTKPEPVNKFAIKVMKEENIDISKNSSNHITDYKKTNFDYVFTVCDNAKENCPVHLKFTKKKIHQSFFDPAKATGSDDEKILVYVKVRNEIKFFLKEFISENKL
tara:strand:- start:3553 stop:3921 length:369 start_codon:yes stop_codon:yes gene_type:complete